MRTPEEKALIKEELIRKIGQTQDKIEKLREQVKPVEPDSAIGRITRMDAIQQKSMCEANMRDSEESLYRLNQMMDQINDDSFGVCAGCGKSIPIERIIAVPETHCCVKCA